MRRGREYKKEVKEQEKSKQRVRPFKNYKFLTKEYLALQEKRFLNLIKRSNESTEERKLYGQFLKLVEHSFKTDNPKKKFSLKFVEQLGIDYDILFLYTKKDVGKTWAAAAYITKLLQDYPDAQVAFIRNSREESKGFIEMMRGSDQGPTIPDTQGNLVYKKEEYLNRKKKTAKLPDPCGIFAYCSGHGFTRGQGGDGNNIKFGYGDECNSVQGGLTQSVFQALNVFLSSLIRDKRGTDKVRGLMTGNLLEKSNIFLERLGVGSKTRLKLFKVHRDNDPKKEVLSTMLYLNTGDLFEGIEGQKGLATQFLDETEMEGLLSNRPGMTQGKAIYEELDLKKMIPRTAFVFRDVREDAVTNGLTTNDYIFYTYMMRAAQPGQLPRMVVWIDRFRVGNIKPGFKSIFCHEPMMANMYPMTIPIEDKDDFGEMFITPIKEYLYAGEVWFGGNGSQEIFELVGDGLQTKYVKEETNPKVH